MRFKPYNQKDYAQTKLCLDDLVPLSHEVRFVDEIISSLDLSLLYESYSLRGASSYDPLLMTKVLFYSYLTGAYSSRAIEKKLRENVCLMWLSGGATPDHNTINRFRLKFMVQLPVLFKELVHLIHQQGFVSLEKVYLDGTKWEANVNKYRFVWGKRVSKNKAKLEAQLTDLNELIAAQVTEDHLSTVPQDIEGWSHRIKEWKTLLDADKIKDTDLIPSIKKFNKEAISRLKDYAMHQRILGDRNSYAKTDTDATFMRLKDDAMKNGQLKAAYNVQMGTENQFITSYSIHQKSNDFGTLIPHLEENRTIYQERLKDVCADAGYGSEQNYQYLEKEGLEAYVKYPLFYQQSKKSFAKNKPFHPDLLFYNEVGDFLVCPMGQKMRKIGERVQKTTLGYPQKYSVYKAINCEGCPIRGRCHQAKGERIIHYNHQLKEYQKKAKEKLNSDEGIKHRKQRGIDVEAVFGQLKQNWRFTRISLRSIPKVTLEVGLMAIAHNLRKLYRKTLQNQQNQPIDQNSFSKSQKTRSVTRYFTVLSFVCSIKRINTKRLPICIMRQPLALATLYCTT